MTENPLSQKTETQKDVVNVKLPLSLLKKKHSEITEQRETLHLRYHQLSGQLEFIEEMMDGRFGELSKGGEP